MKAATVSSLSGQAYVEHGGQLVALENGTELSQSDVVHTKADAKIELHFMDDSIIELGPDTKIEISDFMFNPSGETEPVFALHMVNGVVRSISGKIVEQNPESFKLTSPLGAVGIRGTETLHVIGQESEIHSIINMEAGHTVVISTNAGRSIVLTQSLQGVSIASGGSEMLERDVTPEWLDEFLQQVSGQEISSGGEVPRGYYVIADAAFLSDMDVPTNEKGIAFISEDHLDMLASTLEEAGVESDVLKEALTELTGTSSDTSNASEPLTVAQASVYNQGQTNIEPDASKPLVIDPDEPQPGKDGAIREGTPTPDGDNIAYGGGEFSIAGLEGNDSITIYGQMNGSSVYGEQSNMNGGAGGNDSISIVDHSVLGQGNLESGSIYGDAYAMDDSASGGNDTIYVQGNVGNGSIYGDAYIMNAHNVGGADSITVDGKLQIGGNIYGDAYTIQCDSAAGHDSINVGSMSGGTIYGDAYTVSSSSMGNDTITVGEMSSGIIYGDAYTSRGGVSMGNNNISISGTMSNGSIHASNSTQTGGGENSLYVGNFAGGEIYMAGNISLMLNSLSNAGYSKNIHFSSGNETIGIGGLADNDVTLYLNGAEASDVLYFTSEYNDCFSSYGAGETMKAVQKDDDYEITLSYGDNTLTLLFNAAVSMTVGTHPVDGNNYNSFTVNPVG